MGKFEDIRHAALDIISEGGVRALTLPALFERAHTGAGTFYHYFADRDALVNAVFEYSYEVERCELVEADDPSSSARPRFDAFCYRMYRAYRTHPRELNFLYWYAFGYVEPEVGTCSVIPSVVLLTDIIDAAQKENLIADHSQASVLARVVRNMGASAFWGYERGIYDMSDEAAYRFAKSAWRAIEAL